MQVLVKICQNVQFGALRKHLSRWRLQTILSKGTIIAKRFLNKTKHVTPLHNRRWCKPLVGAHLDPGWSELLNASLLQALSISFGFMTRACPQLETWELFKSLHTHCANWVSDPWVRQPQHGWHPSLQPPQAPFRKCNVKVRGLALHTQHTYTWKARHVFMGRSRWQQLRKEDVAHRCIYKYGRNWPDWNMIDWHLFSSHLVQSHMMSYACDHGDKMRQV